jgi:hypothetical protein
MDKYSDRFDSWLLIDVVVVVGATLGDVFILV